MTEADLDQLIEKHKRFWTPSAGGDVLLAERPHPNWRPKPYPLRGGASISDARQIHPHEVDIKRLLGLNDRLPPLTIGDSITGIEPVYPVCWMESLLGCPIHASAFSCTSKPVPKPAGERLPAFDRGTVFRSPWLEVMDRVIEEEVAAADSVYPAWQLHLRGLIDMLSAYVGEEQLCLSMYDEPQRLRELADDFAGLYVTIAERGLRMRPTWKGGYVSSWGVYAPGPLVDYQIDASNLVSLEAYGRHFAALDEKVLRRFPYSVIHLHACGLHVVDAVLDMKCNCAVEINLDREAAWWNKEAVFNACRKIQDRGKPLIVLGELSAAELDEFLCRLQPDGLAVFYWSPKEGGPCGEPR